MDHADKYELMGVQWLDELVADIGVSPPVIVLESVI